MSEVTQRNEFFAHDSSGLVYTLIEENTYSLHTFSGSIDVESALVRVEITTKEGYVARNSDEEPFDFELVFPWGDTLKLTKGLPKWRESFQMGDLSEEALLKRLASAESGERG